MSGMDRARAELATATFELSFAGIRFATMVDSISTDGDNYKIESSIIAGGPLSWLGIVPIKRTSTGAIDSVSGKVLLRKYTFDSQRDKLTIGIDHNNDLIEYGYKGSVLQVDLPPAAKTFVLHDSLTFAYNFFFFGDRLENQLSYFYLDSRQARIHEWYRADSTEVIELDGTEFHGVRYDKVKEGRHKGSVWFIPDLHMLPGLISLDVGKRIVIEARLTEYSFNS